MSKRRTTRTTVYLAERPLAVLACERTSADLNWTLNQFAQLTEQASADMATLFDADEWRYLLDVFQGRERAADMPAPQYVQWLRSIVEDYDNRLTDPLAPEPEADHETAGRVLAKMHDINPLEGLTIIYALAYGTAMLQTGRLPDQWYAPWHRVDAWMRANRAAAEGGAAPVKRKRK